MDGFCCSKFVLNKLLLTDEVIWNVEIHFHVPGRIIFVLAYSNSAMLGIYQIDTYALDLLEYFNSAMLWMYQIDSFALDLLAYTLILLCSDRQFFFGPVSIL
jgi:hypothetical protein